METTTNATSPLSMRAFITRHKVRMDANLVDKNPNMDGMPEGSTHWRCILRSGPRRMTVFFSQGPAICREPTTEDVLDCLASDASSFENARSFEDWAGDYGYDTDSRKAERIYKTVEKQAAALRRLLPDAYETLLWHTERL